MLARTLLPFTVLALAACSNGDLAHFTGVATPANGLVVSLSVPGPCVNGGCDPVSGQVNQLGLITLRNTGSQKVFVPLCGILPAIGTQQIVNGEWANFGPALACVAGPKSIVIAPNDSLRLNSFYSVGIWRVSVGAATDTALVNEALSISAPVTVK